MIEYGLKSMKPFKDYTRLHRHNIIIIVMIRVIWDANICLCIVKIFHRHNMLDVSWYKGKKSLL